MSKLDNILDGIMVYYGSDQDFDIVTEYDTDQGKEAIKDLMRDLIEETFSKDDSKAYELWKKIEKL